MDKKPAQGVSIHFETPELDKMHAVQDKSQAIGAFLDWLDEQGIVLAKWSGDSRLGEVLVPVYSSIENRLAEYFEIDLDKVEQERRAILDGFKSLAQHKRSVA